MAVLEQLISQVALDDTIKEFTMERKLTGQWTKKTEIYYRKHFQYFQQNAPKNLLEITPAVVLNHLSEIEKGKTFDKGGSRKASPYMKQGAFRALKAFFKWCVDRGYLVKSPINFPIGKSDDKVHIPPTKDQIRTMLDYFDDSFLGKRNKALLYFYANTGCRLNEVLADPANDRTGMLDSDVDLQAREVRIFGKGRKERIVGVQVNTARAMFIYMQAAKKRWPVKQTSAFWLTEEGRPLSGEGFYEVLRKLRKQINLPMSAHDLRRFFITSSLESGMNETAVMALSGHVSHSMMRRYSKTYESARARAQLEKNSPVAGL